jgi:hypothetical protein
MRNFMLPQKAIEEFKKLYAKNYGVELSDEEAIRRANNLVALYGAVYGNVQVGQTEKNNPQNPVKKSP